MARPSFKQSLLFALAVALPSSALILLSWRMISQETELARNRTRERLEQTGRQFGSSLARELERLGDRAESLSMAEFMTAHLSLADTGVALLAELKEGALILPWEAGESRRVAERVEPSFAKEFSAGQRLEYSEGRFMQALASYRLAEQRSGTAGLRATAQLAAARVLMKMGSGREAEAILGQVLRLSFEERDEADIPLALYAAGQLLNRADVSEPLLAIFGRAVEESGEFSPATLCMLRDFLAELSRKSPSAEVRIGPWLAKVQAIISQCSGWELLRTDLQPRLGELAADGNETGDRWFYHEREPGWFVRLCPAREGLPRQLIAVNAQKLAEKVMRDPAFASFGGEIPLLATRPQPQGAWLGEEFSSLQVVPPAPALAAMTVPPQTRHYLLLMALVIGITLFGAHLWARDTRRELQLAALRSGFVSSVSHELKTPLTSMQMLAETIRTRELPPSDRNEYLDLMLAESQRLGRLLNNVLDFSQIEQGERVYHRQPIALQRVVAAAERLARHAMREKNLCLHAPPVSAELRVNVDPDALEQALLNLLYNAVKYSPRDRRIELTVEAAGDEAAITVRDFGVGIHPRDHDRIFERFYRANEVHNRRIPGTGLGLALVKHIAEGNGGRVALQSAPGGGSAFTIHLPLLDRSVTIS